MVSLARGNRGQAVVEFALVFPLLLVLLIGIAEFGRAWMTMNILTSAAREGVRLAVVTAPDVAAVTVRATEVCAAAGITPTSITCSGPLATDPTRRVTVTVQANFTFIPQGILSLLGAADVATGVIPLRATSVMRHESV